MDTPRRRRSRGHAVEGSDSVGVVEPSDICVHYHFTIGGPYPLINIYLVCSRGIFVVLNTMGRVTRL